MQTKQTYKKNICKLSMPLLMWIKMVPICHRPSSTCGWSGNSWTFRFEIRNPRIRLRSLLVFFINFILFSLFLIGYLVFVIWCTLIHSLSFSYGLHLFCLKLCIKMKSYIWLQTADGSIQQVEEEVAMFCPMICREILQTGMGSSKNYAISLPQRVNPAILGLILDYCRFHQVPGRSNKVWYVLFHVNALCLS